MVAIVFDGALSRVEPEPSREAYDAPRETARIIQETLSRRDVDSHVLRFDGSLDELGDRIRQIQARAIFNLCEAGWGDARHEATLARYLEGLGLPYTGCQSLALALAVDKHATQTILAQAGIPMPRSRLLCSGDARGAMEDGLRFPLIIKPNFEDGSVGIRGDSIVSSPDELRARVMQRAGFFAPLLVQEYVEGREFNVAVLGDRTPEVFPLCEVIFETAKEKVAAGGAVTYDAKWTKDSEDWKRTSTVQSPYLGPDHESEIKRLALLAHQRLFCDSYSRMDFRLSENGTPYLLDVNPNPSLGPEDGFARSARQGGYDYGDLLAKILKLAERRWSDRK